MYITDMTGFNLKNSFSTLIHELNQPIFVDQDHSTHTEFTSPETGRDDTFDVLKGIAIICVILGHSEIETLYPFIHSFHIPLFFFISGFFLKLRPLHEEISLSFKRLIVPYIFTAFCICFIAFCKDLSNYTWSDGSHTQLTILKYLLGFKGQTEPDWLVGTISVLWFVLAMFWARIIAVLLIGKIKSIPILAFIFLFLGILGIYLEPNVFVPYCIPQGLSAAGCVYVGYLVKKFNILTTISKSIVFPFFLILWLYSWDNYGVAMVDCIFRTGYVFGVFGALGAFFILHSSVKKLYDKDVLFWKILVFCGRYSLVIYCVHAIDKDVINWKAFALLHHIPLHLFALFQIPSRLALVFLFTLLILKTKPLREGIFQIKTTNRAC